MGGLLAEWDQWAREGRVTRDQYTHLAWGPMMQVHGFGGRLPTGSVKWGLGSGKDLHNQQTPFLSASLLTQCKYVGLRLALSCLF